MARRGSEMGFCLVWVLFMWKGSMLTLLQNGIELMTASHIGSGHFVLDEIMIRNLEDNYQRCYTQLKTGKIRMHY